MAYFQSNYLNKRREDWMKSIHSVEVQVGSTWYKGTINSKKVENDAVVVMATFPQLDDVIATITASRLIDVRGELAAYQSKAIKKVAGQGTMIKIAIPIREV